MKNAPTNMEKVYRHNLSMEWDAQTLLNAAKRMRSVWLFMWRLSLDTNLMTEQG